MVRLLLILAVLALLSPWDWLSSSQAQQREDGSQVGLGDMITMVERTTRDVSGLCVREPVVCRTGERIGSQIRARLVAWMETAHGWLTGPDDRDTASPTGD